MSFYRPRRPKYTEDNILNDNIDSKPEYVNIDRDDNAILKNRWLENSLDDGLLLKEILTDPRQKRSPFCGRKNRCKKRTDPGLSLSLPLSPYKKINERENRWKIPPEHQIFQNREIYRNGDIILVNPSPDVFESLDGQPQLHTKIVSTRQSLVPRRRRKRSVDVAKEPIVTTKHFRPSKEQQICPNHNCGDFLKRKETLENISKDVITASKSSRKMRRHLKTPRKPQNNSSLITTDTVDNVADMIVRKKRNPFCPPYGCWRWQRHKKVTDKQKMFNQILNELIEKVQASR